MRKGEGMMGGQVRSKGTGGRRALRRRMLAGRQQNMVSTPSVKHLRHGRYIVKSCRPPFWRLVVEIFILAVTP